MKNIFVICYEGSPLVVLTNHEYSLPSVILNNYAKWCGFDVSKLSWNVVQSLDYSVVCKDIEDETEN